MSVFVRAAAAAGVLAFGCAGAAAAQEVRVGAGPSGHDLVIQVDEDAGQEQGASVVGEVVFDRLDTLDFIGAPRPYVGASLSLDGFTNFAQAGLLWRVEGERFYADAGIGAAIHDGELELPQPGPGLTPEENAARIKRLEEEIEFGSRVLLHFSLTAGYRVTENWALEIGAQHWSNGAAGDEHNDGADVLHFRAAYRF